MDGKKEIVKILNSMSGRYSGYEIFSDWIRCLALSIEQSTHLIRNKDWQDREQALDYREGCIFPDGTGNHSHRCQNRASA